MKLLKKEFSSIYFLLFLGVLITTQALIFLYQTQAKHFFTADSYEYLKSSENFKTDRTFYCGDLDSKRDPLLYTKRTPGYPLFLAMSGASVSNPLFAVLIQTILFIVFSALFYRLMSRQYNERIVFFVFLAFYLLSPSVWIYPSLIMTEALFQIILSVSFLLTVSFFKTQKGIFLFLSMTAMALSILLKPVALFVAVLSLAPLLFYLFRIKKRILILLFAIPFIASSGHTLLNHSQTKSLSYSSIMQINIMRYDAYMFLKGSRGEAYADSFLQKCHAFRDSSEYSADVEQYYMKESLREIKKNPMKFILFYAKGSINFFLDFGRYDIRMFFLGDAPEGSGLLTAFSKNGYSAILDFLKRRSPAEILSITVFIIFNAAAAVSLFLYIFFGKDCLYTRISVALFVFGIAFATGPIGASRFRHPVFPLILYAAVSNAEATMKKKK